ncbi:MAG: hypothetical protein M2R46_01802 [Verrucomicrobia subdivision 3 bacterium]|nr:hypothetical protein [Limisphaerales bacterium]
MPGHILEAGELPLKNQPPACGTKWERRSQCRRLPVGPSSSLLQSSSPPPSAFAFDFNCGFHITSCLPSPAVGGRRKTRLPCATAAVLQCLAARRRISRRQAIGAQMALIRSRTLLGVSRVAFTCSISRFLERFRAGSTTASLPAGAGAHPLPLSSLLE